MLEPDHPESVQTGFRAASNDGCQEDLAEFEILSRIDSIPLVEIFQARNRDSGQICFVKRVADGLDTEQRSIACALIQNEARVGRIVESGFLSNVLAWELGVDRPYSVTECRGAMLQDRLDSDTCSDDDAIWWTRQCLQGIRDLERQGLRHGDIRPQNIVIDHAGNASLTSFLFCDQLNSPGISQLLTARVEYMSPQRLRADEQPSTNDDIYSLGIVLFQMLSGQLPFGSVGPWRYLQSAVQSELNTETMINAGISPRASDVLCRMFSSTECPQANSCDDLIHELIGLELESMSNRYAA